MTELGEIITKVKRIVTFFKESVVASDDLRKSTTKETKLIQEVKTRWNSKYYMLQRFLSLRREINSVLDNHRSAPNTVTAAEAEFLEECLVLLSPLEVATKELCAKNYVTISKVIPMINCINKKYENVFPTYDITRHLKAKIMSELIKGFGSVEDVTILAIATVLNPRFKKIHFNNPIFCSRAVSAIKSEMQKK